MSVTIYSHPDCLKHTMGSQHPESPERVKAILNALKKADFVDDLVFKTPIPAKKEHLIRVHDVDYVENLFSIAPKQGTVQLDPDTAMNPYTLQAALLASGALVNAVDDVFEGKTKRVFCCVRPPGHHAEPNQAMGFCFFNNIAVGVAHAISQYHCQRVAIVDFDVHHGNGTQSMFANNPKVLMWSSFQHPFYPGTALSDAPPNIHLCPLEAGTDSHVFRYIVDDQLIPLLEEFKPECIFISAGFDAHRGDPLANINLESTDYGYITEAIVKVADKYAQGRIISTLEGGYHLSALAESALYHVKALGL